MFQEGSRGHREIGRGGRQAIWGDTARFQHGSGLLLRGEGPEAVLPPLPRRAPIRAPEKLQQDPLERVPKWAPDMALEQTCP